MSADDQFESAPEQGFPSNADYPSNVDTSSAYTGNRPASGARRATPGEVLSQGFQGAENAGDFLGLDVEFTGSQGQGLEGGLDLVPPPGTYAPAEGEYAAPVPAPMPQGDAAQEFAQAPSAFEFGEDLGSEEAGAEESFSGAAAAGGGKAPLLVGGLVLAGLAAAGFFFGPGLYSKYVTKGSSEVAKAPSGEAKPAKSGGPAKSEPKGEIAALPAAGAGEAAAKTPTEPTPSQPVAKTPVDSEPRPPRNGGNRESTLAPTPGKAPVEPSTTPSEPEVAVASTPQARASASFPDIASEEYDWASKDQLELIWRGSEVPLEAVRGPSKTLMPKVGQVRVFTTAGDVFDGRLYAVGQNRVWVDAAPGRIGLDGGLVERIEVLPRDANVDKDGAPIAGGKQVRARVAGGVLYGRILKSSGDSVTLALEDGGRVIVKAGDLEDLGSGRATVVRR